MLREGIVQLNCSCVERKVLAQHVNKITVEDLIGAFHTALNDGLRTGQTEVKCVNWATEL